MLEKTQIVAGLRELGLASGDLVLLHSSLASLGRVDGGAESVVEAFLEVLGTDGTLVVPAFGELGVIPEIVKADPRAVRSVHPLASVAAIGPKAEALCRDHWKAPTAHGPDTPYTRIAELGGWVCLLGVDQDRNTTLHTVEALLELPYLKTTAERTFQTPDGKVTKSWDFFPGPHRDFIRLDRPLRESGRMQIGQIGTSVVRLIRSRDLIDRALEIGRADPGFVLCENPHCADCVRQRAQLRRSRFVNEPFTLVAAASLAGRYVPEIIENLHAAGIDAVELDGLEGRPAGRLGTERLKRVLQEFAEAGLAVSALRCEALADDRSWMQAVAEAGIPRVILPISDSAGAEVRAATVAGLAIDLTNTDCTSPRASRILQSLRAEKLDAGFVFNPARFAALGEKPFLESYKTKLRRFLGQLDLCDATFAGRPTPLAEGNGEVKEMVSILRCASFPGRMTLGPANHGLYDAEPRQNLLECTRRLERLLEAM